MNIIDFYCKDGKHLNGMSHSEILQQSDFYLEASHDLIQWVFPLHEPSNFNDECPIVKIEDVEILRNCPIAQNRMDQSITRFSKFLGFDSAFNYADNFSICAKGWRSAYNHNLLRITRAIRSMRIFGFEEKANKLFDVVYKTGTDAGCVSGRTYKFWKLALEDDIFETLRK